MKMSVKPILFNTEMVRAILDGRKVVTRRLIKKLPDDAEFSGWLLDSTCQENAKDIGSAGFKTLKQPTEKAGCLFVKPQYQSGDILYVRETWCKNPNYEEYYFKTRQSGIAPYGLKWHPSIHMPKEAARIFLKVTDVRVERLQEIDIDGIRNEGLTSMSVYAGDMDIALEEWKILWNSTIKKSDLDRYGWEANPYVWVIEFERCENQEGE